MERKEVYHILSNTHWDREWYQSHEKYLVRLVELFDRLTNILETQPGYRFMTDGQFALVEDYLTARPEKKEQLEKFVKNGQLLIGPWYTQPLQNIVGGEALIRNLQTGIEKSDALGGAMRFSYEIDEFGHASQMPQIYNGFGITGAMAWRGNPKGAKSVFEWIAPDGSSVNMFYSKNGYGFATTLPENEEDFTEVIDGVPFKRRGIKNRVRALREYTLEYSETDHMFWLNGIDHSFAQEDLLRVIKKIRELFPDIEVKQSTPPELEKEARADLAAKGILPVKVTGELLFTREDILESTNALHPRQKQAHALSEHHLTDRFEPMAAFASLLGKKYPAWALDRAWKYVLENHAHDSLGCCSVDEVFQQVMARYGACVSLCEQEEEEALRYVMSCSDGSPAVFVFNFTSYPAGGVKKCRLDVPAGLTEGFFSLKTPDGSTVPVEILKKELVGDVRYNPRRGHPTWGRRWVFDMLAGLPEVPAYGWIKLTFENAADEKRVANRRYYCMEKAAGVMENEFLKIAVRQNGTFDLTDKTNGRVYPSQLLFEDTGEAGDVYIHSEPVNDHRRLYARNTSVSCLYDTPLGAAYELCFAMQVPEGITANRKDRLPAARPLIIRTTLTLLKGAKRADISIHVENRSENHRLRVLFPSYLADAKYSKGKQAFDFPARPISEAYDPELPREQAYPTKPMLGVCAVAEEKSGLGVAAKGIFEYECTDDDARALAVTLLRAVEVIDTKTFAETPEYICREAQNLTDLDFELSLIPYGGTDAEILREAEAFLNAATVIFNRAPEVSVLPEYERPALVLPDTGSIFRIRGENVTVTSFKKAKKEDAYILRLLNGGETETDVFAEFTLPGISVKEIYSATLEEKKLEKLAGNGSVSLRIPAHKLATLLIKI